MPGRIGIDLISLGCRQIVGRLQQPGAERDRLVVRRREVVDVEVEVRHQWPADVLVDDSRNASLVVIGRRGVHGWVPEHLGSLARTVLRAARCPVMVVPVVAMAIASRFFMRETSSCAAPGARLR